MKKIKFSRQDDEYSYSNDIFYSSQSYHEVILPEMDPIQGKQAQEEQMKKEIRELPPQVIDLHVPSPNQHKNTVIFESNEKNNEAMKDICDNHNKKVASRYRSKSQQRPTPSKSRKSASRKTSRNQYDTNIFANITKVIIKKIINKESQQLIDNYCEAMRMNSTQFYDIFLKMDRQDIRMGTTELSSFLNSTEYKSEIKLLFSYFIVHFLKEDYLAYVILHGKMRDKEKYVRCATKMMYIPQLSECDYWLIFELGKSQRI